MGEEGLLTILNTAPSVWELKFNKNESKNQQEYWSSEKIKKFFKQFANFIQQYQKHQKCKGKRNRMFQRRKYKQVIKKQLGFTQYVANLDSQKTQQVVHISPLNFLSTSFVVPQDKKEGQKWLKESNGECGQIKTWCQFWEMGDFSNGSLVPVELKQAVPLSFEDFTLNENSI